MMFFVLAMFMVVTMATSALILLVGERNGQFEPAHSECLKRQSIRK